MFMTNQERELRKNLRLKLEEIADRNKLFDNHGNEIKAIHITDVIRLLLEEDTEILDTQKEIQKLTKIRMELMTNSAIIPNEMFTEAMSKFRGLGIANFVYTQSLGDLSPESIDNRINEILIKLRKDRGAWTPYMEAKKLINDHLANKNPLPMIVVMPDDDIKELLQNDFRLKLNQFKEYENEKLFREGRKLFGSVFKIYTYLEYKEIEKTEVVLNSTVYKI